MPAQNGVGKGMPRFLSRPKASEADVSSSSEKEARESAGHAVEEAPVATPLGVAAAQAMHASPDKGRGLSEGERAETENRLGEDFSDVSVTENSDLASAFGANAMTYGDAIHVAPGRNLNPDLLSHELTHVSQQRRFGAQGAQFDISMSAVDEDTGLGLMDISMVTKTEPRGSATKSGVETEIDFLPHATAPYANRIGLIQTVDDERLDMPDQPDYVWTGDEANREHVKNDEGTFVDTYHAKLPEDRNAEPWYWAEQTAGEPDVPTNIERYGWNRSPDDRHSTHLYDYPGSTGARRFKFETVAVGRDSQIAYGSVRWGFDTDAGAGTSNEWYDITKINESGTDKSYTSDSFESALDKYRDFYVHEPIIVYFGSAETSASESELAKLSDAPGYLAENPEAQIRLTATSDMQGGVGDANHQLALDRMNSVYAELVRLGVAESDIVLDETGANASRAQGSTDPTLQDSEGSLQANRRVTVTFENVESLSP